MKGMEKIELVIKIPKAYYELVLEQCKDPVLLNAFKNGVLLPKGHGRLIDAKEVYKKFYCRCLAGVATEVLNETLIIIEADKEGEK